MVMIYHRSAKSHYWHILNETGAAKGSYMPTTASLKYQLRQQANSESCSQLQVEWV